MPFRNPIVAGGVLVSPSIQSPNYRPGVFGGWKIGRDGSAQFSDLEVFGDENNRAVGFLSDYMESVAASQSKGCALELNYDVTTAAADLLFWTDYQFPFIYPTTPKKVGWKSPLEGYTFTVFAELESRGTTAGTWNPLTLIGELEVREYDQARVNVVATRKSVRQFIGRSAAGTRAQNSQGWSFNVKRDTLYSVHFLVRYSGTGTGFGFRFNAPHTGFTLDHALVAHRSELF